MSRSRRPSRKKADLKVAMVGDASVGKTSLVLRYMERHFKETLSTIGASFMFKSWGHYNIAIWDTAGEEKYAGLTTFYYRNASAAILTFDMFDKSTYENLSRRYIPLLNNVGSAELKVIVATKWDLLSCHVRRVSEEEGIQLAKNSNPNIDFSSGISIPYFETSSKTGHNVDRVFEYIFEHFFPNKGIYNWTPDDVQTSITLDDSKSKKTNCC